MEPSLEGLPCSWCGGTPFDCCAEMRQATQTHAEILEALPKLDLETPVDSVVLQDEVKLFRLRATLIYLDGHVFDFNYVDVSALPPVPVHDQANRRIGFASVEALQGPPEQLVADIVIDYATEERLLIETGEKLYAFCFGHLKIRQDANGVFDLHRPLPVELLTVDGIQLLRRTPTDSRIDPVLVQP